MIDDGFRAMPFRPALPMNRAVFHRLGLSVGIAIALVGCDDRAPLPPPSSEKVVPAYKAPVEEETQAERQEADEEALRERQIQATRQSDPSLNWVNIGITTGKFSESIGSSVHKTYEECVQRSWMEDNECFPIRALPDSYWNAKPERTGA